MYSPDNFLKWQNLLAQIEVFEYLEEIKYKYQEISNEEDLLKFEFKWNRTLPDSYKDFCQVFGTGMFGECLRIYCPNIEESNRTIANLNNVV